MDKPVCQTARAWLKQHKHSMAGLTGQDSRALSAFVHLLELYSVSDENGCRHALVAMRHAVLAMQPTTQHLAKRAIPHALDWGDEDPLWKQIMGTELRLVQ